MSVKTRHPPTEPLGAMQRREPGTKTEEEELVIKQDQQKAVFQQLVNQHLQNVDIVSSWAQTKLRLRDGLWN